MMGRRCGETSRDDRLAPDPSNRKRETPAKKSEVQNSSITDRTGSSCSLARGNNAIAERHIVTDTALPGARAQNSEPVRLERHRDDEHRVASRRWGAARRGVRTSIEPTARGSQSSAMMSSGATSTPRRRRATAATARDPSGALAESDGFDAWPMRVVTYIAYLLLVSSLLWTLFRGSGPEAPNAAG